ncbi:HD domain-containing protein [Candidatus Micrarchaeota archaeon]|nr:HD domain-containing protein [Candidatus Micrarchaeota archaeon]
MHHKEKIEETATFAEKLLSSDASGHDWFHTKRVWKLAKKIGEKEGADLFVVELAALLHDIWDWKFHQGDETAGSKKAMEFMESIGVDGITRDKVCSIIQKTSFKGARVKEEELSLEGKCVQDADRLDAIGAIGIARAFAYGGHVKQPLFDPSIKPILHESKEDYFKANTSTINHFYEKLLLLKDRMKTETGKKMAEKRHAFMEEFLEEFFKEWNCGE